MLFVHSIVSIAQQNIQQYYRTQPDSECAMQGSQDQTGHLHDLGFYLACREREQCASRGLAGLLEPHTPT